MIHQKSFLKNLQEAANAKFVDIAVSARIFHSFSNYGDSYIARRFIACVNSTERPSMISHCLTPTKKWSWEDFCE